MSSSYFKITGKNPLSGTITPQGNKNEALPVLGAVCMIPGIVRLENVPMISDVLMLIDVLRHLNFQITNPEEGVFTFQRPTELKSDLPQELCSKIRGAVTLAGPILASTGRVFLPRPGGDKIGRRRLDTHLLALEALGADIEVFPDGYEIKANRLVGDDILLDEASVTGTENAVMAACLAQGTTIIRHAASEPHVQGLCRLLNSAGAKISGIGSNILTIEGVTSLSNPTGTITHRIGSDYLEVGSFISLAAVTGGELFIRDVNPDDIRMIRLVYSRLGIEVRFACFGSLFENLIQFVNIIGSVFYGTILGIFIVAFYFKSIKGNAVFYAALIAECLLIIIFKSDIIGYLWLNAIGCGLVIIFGLLFQFILPKNNNEQATSAGF